MEFKIVWSEFAEKQLDKIFNYYRKNASLTVAQKLVESIVKEPNKLKNSNFIGQKEELLENRKIEYRYLVHKNYKLIYSVDQLNSLIKIADVFDTRQNPIKINRKK